MCEPPEIKAADLHDGHDKERVNRAKLPRSPRLPVAVGQTGADHGVILTSPRKQNIADPSLPSDVEVFHLLSDGTRQHCAIVLLLLSKMAPMRVLRYLRYNSDRCRIKWKLLTTKTISYSVSFFFFIAKGYWMKTKTKQTTTPTPTTTNKHERVKRMLKKHKQILIYDSCARFLVTPLSKQQRDRKYTNKLGEE